MNEPQEKDWITSRTLVNDFLERHQISGVRVEESQILQAAKAACIACWPAWRKLIEVKHYREPEIIIVAADPMVAQEVRLGTLGFIQRVTAALPALAGKLELRVRVVGG